MEKSEKKAHSKDEKFLKELIKTSVKKAEENASSYQQKNSNSANSRLNIGLIEAYEIGLLLNFQPLLMKRFLSIVSKYLLKYNFDILKL